MAGRVSKPVVFVSSPSSDLILGVEGAGLDVEEEEEDGAPRWRREAMCEHPGGIWRTGRAVLVVGLVEMGVPAREAAAEDGFVGETEPPLERWDEFQLATLVSDVMVDDGIVMAVQGLRRRKGWCVTMAKLVLVERHRSPRGALRPDLPARMYSAEAAQSVIGVEMVCGNEIIVDCSTSAVLRCRCSFQVSD